MMTRHITWGVFLCTCALVPAICVDASDSVVRKLTFTGQGLFAKPVSHPPLPMLLELGSCASHCIGAQRFGHRERPPQNCNNPSA